MLNRLWCHSPVALTAAPSVWRVLARVLVAMWEAFHRRLSCSRTRASSSTTCPSCRSCTTERMCTPYRALVATSQCTPNSRFFNYTFSLNALNASYFFKQPSRSLHNVCTFSAKLNNGVAGFWHFNSAGSALSIASSIHFLVTAREALGQIRVSYNLCVRAIKLKRVYITIYLSTYAFNFMK